MQNFSDSLNKECYKVFIQYINNGLYFNTLNTGDFDYINYSLLFFLLLSQLFKVEHPSLTLPLIFYGVYFMSFVYQIFEIEYELKQNSILKYFCRSWLSVLIYLVFIL